MPTNSEAHIRALMLDTTTDYIAHQIMLRGLKPDMALCREIAASVIGGIHECVDLLMEKPQPVVVQNRGGLN